MHYYRLARTGTLEQGPGRPKVKCSGEGCEAMVQVRRRNRTLPLCAKHYARWCRHGSTDALHLHDGHAKDRSRESTKRWKAANWPTYKAYLAARKSRVKQATPPWADLGAIAEFYRACPPGFHVDHVVPLNGRAVSGLHVVTNLQYLPAAENLRKGNKLLTA
jgi:hypothetical protein